MAKGSKGKMKGKAGKATTKLIESVQDISRPSRTCHDNEQNVNKQMSSGQIVEMLPEKRISRQSNKGRRLSQTNAIAKDFYEGIKGVNPSANDDEIDLDVTDLHEPSNLNDKATKGGDKADKITTAHFEEEGEDFIIEVQFTEFESEDKGTMMTMGDSQDVNSKEVTLSPQQLSGPKNNNAVLLNASGEQAGCSSGAGMKESEQFQFEKFA